MTLKGHILIAMFLTFLVFGYRARNRRKPMKAISFLLTSNLPSKADTVHGLGEFYQAFQEDPALKDLTMRRVRSQKNKRGPGRGRAANDYASKVKRSIRGVRYKEGLRKQDVAGCGPPICTIIDMRIKTFKSFCHLVEYANDQGLHRRIFEIQKGSCETASKNLNFRAKQIEICFFNFSQISQGKVEHISLVEKASE